MTELGELDGCAKLDFIENLAETRIGELRRPPAQGAHELVQLVPRHPTGQQAKTLAHELAHEAMHWEDRGPLTRSIAELEAESVAYVVCKHFGLDAEVRSSRYIALWDGDAKALRASLERIAKAARAMIDDVAAIAGKKAVA